jgi:hexosaminidase
METYFHEKGRELVGWDEILDGGISRTAVIMYWRTWVPDAPIEAAKNGNKVVMSPGNPLYFNQQPDKNSYPAVYNYNPIPPGLSATEAGNIIGAQANLWAEQVPSTKRADYLYMPRMTALAERLWTNRGDYKIYKQRLNYHYARLDLLKVNYRLPDLPLLENYVFSGKTVLKVEKPLTNLIMRYTLDSTMPGILSSVLTDSLAIHKSQFVRLAAFKQDGTRGDVYDIHYKKQNLAEPENVSAVKEGLNCSWYKRSFSSTTLIPRNDPDGSSTVRGIIVPKEAEAASFALQYRGYIEVPEEGIYSFYLTSDDASVLRIASQEVINNDGMHPPKERNGQAGLKKGLHKIELDFIEGGGGYTLKLQYSKKGNEPQDIPAAWFKN